MKSVLEICRTYRRGLCGQRGWGGAYRGVGELFILLLLAGVAGIALLVYAQAEREDLRHDQALATGKLVGTWLRYAHLYAQDNQQDLTVMRNGNIISKIIPLSCLNPSCPPNPSCPNPSCLKPSYAPVWLKETTGPRDKIILGIIDDGVPRTGSTPGTGIPMAFVIWNRTTVKASDLLVDFRDSVAQGLSLAEGLNAEQFATIIDVTDSTAQSIGISHRAKIETLLKQDNPTFLDNDEKLPFGTIMATADSAIAYNADALYRRRQPGHPELNRMLGDINLDEHNFTAGIITMTARKSGEISEANVMAKVIVKATTNLTKFENLEVTGNVTANTLALDSVKGAKLESDHMKMEAPGRGINRILLFVGTLVEDGTLDTGTLERVRNIAAEGGVFTTSLDISNSTPSSNKVAVGVITVLSGTTTGTTTADDVLATTIKGGTTPSEVCPGRRPSGVCPSPGELIVTTDKYTQRPGIVKTP